MAISRLRGGAPQRMGWCVDFDGATEYATFPDWTATGSTWVIGADVAITPGVGIQSILCRADTDSLWMLRLTAGEQAEIAYVDDGAVARTATGTTVLVEGEWYTIRVEFYSDRVELYVNGVLEATGADAPGASPAWGKIATNHDATTNFFDGYMRNVLLTDIDDPDNSRLYPMNEGSGSVIYNTAG